MSDPSLPFDWSDASDEELYLIALESSDATSIRCAVREIVARQLEHALRRVEGRGALALAREARREAQFRVGARGAPGRHIWAAALQGLTWLETALAAAGDDPERISVVLDLSEAFAGASAIVQHVVRQIRAAE